MFYKVRRYSTGDTQGIMETCHSTVRCIENVPILGHIMAAVYACSGDVTRAERSAIKATIGILLLPFNVVAEAVDEATRKKPEKLGRSSFSARLDWMKRYKSLPLRNICLPGSHQSATYKMTKKLTKVPLMVGWSRYQKLNVQQQLRTGIRFLDLHVMSHDGDIWTHSGHVVCVRLREILAEVRDFVAGQPSELIVLHLTNDKKVIDWSACRHLILEVVRERLVPEVMKDLVIGKLTSSPDVTNY